jgi:hypothetical protein
MARRKTALIDRGEELRLGSNQSGAVKNLIARGGKMVELALPRKTNV